MSTLNDELQSIQMTQKEKELTNETQGAKEGLDRNETENSLPRNLET